MIDLDQSQLFIRRGPDVHGTKHADMEDHPKSRGRRKLEATYFINVCKTTVISQFMDSLWRLCEVICQRSNETGNASATHTLCTYAIGTTVHLQSLARVFLESNWNPLISLWNFKANVLIDDIHLRTVDFFLLLEISCDTFLLINAFDLYTCTWNALIFVIVLFPLI